jgi:hypothetical protein
MHLSRRKFPNSARRSITGVQGKTKRILIIPPPPLSCFHTHLTLLSDLQIEWGGERLAFDQDVVTGKLSGGKKERKKERKKSREEQKRNA